MYNIPRTNNNCNTTVNSSTYTKKLSSTMSSCGPCNSVDNSECCSINAAAIQDISSELNIVDASINYLIKAVDFSGIISLINDVSENVYDNSRVIIELNNELDDLSGVVQDLSSSVYDLSGEIFYMPGVVRDLSNVVLDLSGDHYTLKSGFNDLSNVVLDLSGDHYTLKSGFNDLSNVVLDLSGKVVNNATAITTKVSKSGDTMTGDLTFDQSSNYYNLRISTNQFGTNLQVADPNTSSYSEKIRIGNNFINTYNAIYSSSDIIFNTPSGIVLNDATAPSNKTNKLYRSGNDIYWDNNKLSVWDVSGSSLVLDNSYNEIIIPGSRTSFGVDRVNKEAIFFTDLSNIKMNIQGNNALTLTDTGVDLSGVVNFSDNLTAEKGLVLSNHVPTQTASTIYTNNGSDLFFGSNKIGIDSDITTNATAITTKVSKSGDTMTGSLDFVVGSYGGRVTTTNDGLSLQTDNGSNRNYNEKIRILDSATNLYTPTYHNYDLIMNAAGKGIVYDNANSTTTKLYYDGSLKFGNLNISNFDTRITSNANSITDVTNVVDDLSNVVLDLSGDHYTLKSGFNDLSNVVLDLSGDHYTLKSGFNDLSNVVLDLSGKVVNNATAIATKVSKSGDTMTGALDFVVGSYGGRVTTTNYGLSLQTDNGSNRNYNEKIRVLNTATNLYTPTYHNYDLIMNASGKGVIFDNANSTNTKLYYDKPNTSLKFGSLNISNFDTRITSNANSITDITNVVDDLSNVVLDLSGNHNTLNTAFIDLSTNHNTLNTAFNNLNTNTSNNSIDAIDLTYDGKVKNYDLKFSMQPNTNQNATINGNFLINDVPFPIENPSQTLEYYFNPPFYDPTNDTQLSDISGWIINGNATNPSSYEIRIDLTKPLLITNINPSTNAPSNTYSVKGISVGDTSYNSTFFSGSNNITFRYKQDSGLYNTIDRNFSKLDTSFIDLSNIVTANTNSINANTNSINENINSISTKVSKTGDTITGNLDISGANLHVQNSNGQITIANTAGTGGTMTLGSYGGVGVINYRGNNIITSNGTNIDIGHQDKTLDIKFYKRLIYGPGGKYYNITGNVNYGPSEATLQIRDEALVNNSSDPTSNTNRTRVNDQRIFNYNTQNLQIASDDVVYLSIQTGRDILVMGGASFRAVSDGRIKTNIVDASNSLEVMRKIPLRNYEYIDKYLRGNRSVKGWIAQEVRTHLPEAIRLMTDYIPNIMLVGEINNNILTTSEPFDVSNTNVKIMDNSDNNYFINLDNKLNVSSGSKYQISFIGENNSQTENYQGPCFVYGESVDDFHVIDKAYMTTLLYGAVSELDENLTSEVNRLTLKTNGYETEKNILVNKVYNLEQDNENLKAENALLKQQILSIEQRLSAIEASAAGSGSS